MMMASAFRKNTISSTCNCSDDRRMEIPMMVNINNATSIISDAWSVAGKDVKRLNTVMNLCLAVLDGTPFHYRIAAAKRQIKLAVQLSVCPFTQHVLIAGMFLPDGRMRRQRAGIVGNWCRQPHWKVEDIL